MKHIHELISLLQLCNDFQFPLSLDMKNYKLVKHDTDNMDTSEYDLSTIILHDGSATSGHYLCFARPDIDNQPDSWLRLNDHIVSEVTFENVLLESVGGDSHFMGTSKNAYILQYVKKNFGERKKLRRNVNTKDIVNEKLTKNLFLDTFRKIINTHPIITLPLICVSSIAIILTKRGRFGVHSADSSSSF